MIRIHAISGSLRQHSTNTELLRATALLVPEGVSVELEQKLGELPHFNPDLEGREAVSVVDFRERLRRADAIIISSPEYAHGISGVLKDALDWTVGSGEFSGKPVALFNASPRASLAQESLAEIIRTMDASLVTEATLALPLLGKKLTADQIVQDAAMQAEIQRSLTALLAAIGR